MEDMVILVKPHAVRAGYANEIIAIIERMGYKVIAQQLMTPRETLIREHYAEHEGRDYFERLVESMRGPVMAVVFHGRDGMIKHVRDAIGDTYPEKAAAWTIRYKYGRKVPDNAIHGSDSPESATREINLWFPTKQWVIYERDRAP